MEGFLSEVMRLGRPLFQQADDEPPLQRLGDGDEDSRHLRRTEVGYKVGKSEVPQPPCLRV